MLKLTYKGDTTIPIEAEVIAPDHLRDKSTAEVAKLAVQHGNAEVPLGEFFHVEGQAGDGEIHIEGDCSKVKWLGTGMTAGKLTVHGNTGMHLGSEMVGGRIEVHGNTGDWVGGEMRGGHIHVHGNAGHLAGAAYRGSRHGMRGGVLLIDGNAGNEIGATMRRGLIAIGGDTGDFVGVSLIAGTIVVAGAPGIRVGAGMKRGSIILTGSRPKLLPSFKYDCLYRPVFLRVYLRQLRQWGFPLPVETVEAHFHRHSGDLVALGKGEILVMD